LIPQSELERLERDEYGLLWRENPSLTTPPEEKIQFHITPKEDRIDIVFFHNEDVMDVFKAICSLFNEEYVGIKYSCNTYPHLELSKFGTIMWKRFINYYVFYDKLVGYYCTSVKINKEGNLVLNPDKTGEKDEDIRKHIKEYLIQSGEPEKETEG
jgi:hypothetical protein